MQPNTWITKHRDVALMLLVIFLMNFITHLAWGMSPRLSNTTVVPQAVMNALYIQLNEEAEKNGDYELDIAEVCWFITGEFDETTELCEISEK